MVWWTIRLTFDADRTGEWCSTCSNKTYNSIVCWFYDAVPDVPLTTVVNRLRLRSYVWWLPIWYTSHLGMILLRSCQPLYWRVTRQVFYQPFPLRATHFCLPINQCRHLLCSASHYFYISWPHPMFCVLDIIIHWYDLVVCDSCSSAMLTFNVLRIHCASHLIAILPVTRMTVWFSTCHSRYVWLLWPVVMISSLLLFQCSQQHVVFIRAFVFSWFVSIRDDIPFVYSTP